MHATNMQASQSLVLYVTSYCRLCDSPASSPTTTTSYLLTGLPVHYNHAHVSRIRFVTWLFAELLTEYQSSMQHAINRSCAGAARPSQIPILSTGCRFSAVTNVTLATFTTQMLAVRNL